MRLARFFAGVSRFPPAHIARHPLRGSQKVPVKPDSADLNAGSPQEDLCCDNRKFFAWFRFGP